MNISESFYSIQGEGPSTGAPARFVRLAGCNLACGGGKGDLLNRGLATWHCDTEAIWRKATLTTPLDFIRSFPELPQIYSGQVHIVYTGGEPLLPKNRADIEEMETILSSYEEDYSYAELETNGTIEVPVEFFTKNINQINCSPKLANSGMAPQQRIVPGAIENILEAGSELCKAGGDYCFKFVINRSHDFEEIMRDFITPFNIPRNKVWLMPGCDRFSTLQETTKLAVELARDNYLHVCTRLHVLCWDRTTGV